MIIWGSRGLTSLTGTGEFNCPACGTMSKYAKRLVRRWFTLYFIPIFPISSQSEYVECQRCMRAFDPGALTTDHAEQAARMERAFAQAACDVAILGAMADGGPEFTPPPALLDWLGQSGWKAADIQARAAALRQTPAALRSVLGVLAPSLNVMGKATLVQAATVGLSTPPSAGGMRFLDELAQVLQVPKESVRRALGSERSKAGGA